MLLGVARNAGLMRNRPVAWPLLLGGWMVTGVITLSSVLFIIESLTTG
jgi:hypothetical protein